MNGNTIYNDGSIAVTNGSTAVVGTDTAWLTNMPLGADIKIPASTGAWYKAAVTGEGAITLDRGYEGTTDTGVAYEANKNTSLATAAANIASVAASYKGVAFLTAGDQYWKLNKATATDNAGMWLQTGGVDKFRAGSFGDDTFGIQYLTDGIWKNAISVAEDTGLLNISATVTDPNTGQPTVRMLPAPVVSDLWRSDATRLASPRTYTLSSIAGASLVLTEVRANEINGSASAGTAMVRIWNTTKSPAQPAWVIATDSNSTCTVLDAATISSWTAGDTIQLGDPNPTDDNVLGMIALDLSPYMIANFGAAFRQKGLLLSTLVTGIGGAATAGVSGNGAGGSASDANSLDSGGIGGGFLTVFTPVLSPVSNSNLVFVRERLVTGTSLSTVLCRLVGIYV